jgi:uncharacterized protein
MPYFVIHAIDRAASADLRQQHYPAHRAFLGESASRGVVIAASGPLLSDDGAATIGSCFILEADDIDQAKAFNAADPFAQAGLWADVRIHRFDIRRGSVGAGR